MSGADELAAVLARLETAAGPGDAGAARTEAGALAAAVAVHARGADADWATVFGAGFAAAARDGEPYLRAPTPLLVRFAASDPAIAIAYAHALAEVASAACSLGEPGLESITRASMAAAAQLLAGGVVDAARAVDTHLDHTIGTPVPAPAAPHSAPPTPTAAAEPPPAKPLAELLAELDGLTGLSEVKSQVRREVNLRRANELRKQKNMKLLKVARHLVFVGNPGTGKTTVARIVVQIYRALGILTKGQLVETDRAGLVAGYEGQTAIKTEAKVQEAVGGGLFIDEAYALLRDDADQFGHEAVDTLVKLMEDHRDELVVVAAGYPDEMDVFISSNPGLESRFPLTITFADYTDDELVAIFSQLAADNDFAASDEVVATVRTRLSSEPRGRGFGNARFIRNLFEDAAANLATRIAAVADPTADQLRQLETADITLTLHPPEGAQPQPPVSALGSDASAPTPAPAPDHA
jgi:Holliday junction resolvasome RuvABC ATP-dependent DNA helicase subunit